MTASIPFELVLFDLDGTLVDSLPDIAKALNLTLTGAGLPTLAIETVARFVGDGAAKLVERAFAGSAADLQRRATWLERFLANYADVVCVESRLYPGVTDLLAALGNRGISTAVLTNKPGPLARALLGALGVADGFRAIIGDGDGFPRKPDTAAARSVMERLAAPAARTIVVGDGLPDVRMARSIPCPALAAGWGYAPVALLAAEQPTFLAASVAEAARILLAGIESAPS